MQSSLFDVPLEPYRINPELFCGRTPYDEASFPPPRPFQVTAHEALRQGVRDGHRVQMIMAPTGAGKTFLAMQVIHETLKKGNRCLFIADRTVLIDQTSRVADQYGLNEHGIIQANHWRTDYSKAFQIGSVQTIARRKIPPFDVIVVDESHSLYKGWVDLVNTTDAKCILLSATPFSKGLGKIASNLINAATMHALTESGVLVPMKVYSCHKVDMAGAATKGGEWTERAAAERGLKIVGDVVTDWMKYGYPRKTVVFGATIAHCEEMARQFNDAGVKAAVFCADTTPEERDYILSDYRKPESDLKVLISVEALAKGFDCPEVSCICDVRPLRKSLSTAIQMWGRGLRSCEGKTDLVLLDFSGNIVRFADDFSDIYYNGLDKLDAGEKLDKTIRRDEEKKEAKCPKCGYTPCGKKCLQCGHERKRQSTIEAEAGEMKEVFIGKTKLADDKRHLWEQVVNYTRQNGKPETMEARAYYAYRDMTGVEPSKQWQRDFHAIPPANITRAVKNEFMRKRLAFIKGREKHAAV